MRNFRFDSLRGMAMVGIVLIHVHSYYTFFHSSTEPNQLLTLILANLSRFSVPVFIFSAGFFLKNSTFFEYWKPKIITVLIPYIFFATIGYFIKFNEYSSTDLLYRLLVGQVFTPFYFIPLLVQFYIMYFVLFRREYNLATMTSILILSLIFNIASNLNYFDFFSNDYSVISPFNFLFFFSLGIFIRKIFKRIEYISEDYILQPLFSISLILMGSIIVYNSIDTIQGISNHTIIYPSLFIIVFMGLNLSDRIQNITSNIGENSMGIFLLHPFVIHFMHTFDPYVLGGGWLSIPIITLINVAIPLYIWRYLKKFISFL